MNGVKSRTDINPVHANPVAKMFFQAEAAAVGNQQTFAADRTPGEWSLSRFVAHFTHHDNEGFRRHNGTIGIAKDGMTAGAAPLALIRHWRKLGGLGHGSAIARGQSASKYRMIALLLASLAGNSAIAQVPVNDAERTIKETETRTCIQRARTYKQRAEAPTNGIRGSVAGAGESGGQRAGGVSIGGGAFSGTTIGGIDLSALMMVAGAASALKAKNAGEVFNAIAATQAAIQSNQALIAGQGSQIGSATSIQGAFDQNSGTRLSGSSLWGQAVEGGNTTVKIRNQQLMDEAAAQSRAARIWGKGGAANENRIDPATIPDNAAAIPMQPSTAGQVAADLKKAQAEALAKSQAEAAAAKAELAAAKKARAEADTPAPPAVDIAPSAPQPSKVSAAIIPGKDAATTLSRPSAPASEEGLQ